MNLSNTVIKIINKEHGKKVIQWWKDQGVDVTHYEGTNLDYPYYGLYCNKSFNNFSEREVMERNLRVIELPSDLPKRGDRVLVWDYNEKTAVDKIFLAYIKELHNPVICVSQDDETNFLNNKLVMTTSWKHYKLIEPKKEISFTVEEIANKLGITLEQVKEMKIIFGQESK